eukprot:1834758-Lingulodinium_polyedra.AAC.1
MHGANNRICIPARTRAAWHCEYWAAPIRTECCNASGGRWTGPPRPTALAIHTCWRALNDDRMDPPIQTEYDATQHGRAP